MTRCTVEHSDSEKIFQFNLIRFSTSLPYRRIATIVYYVTILLCQMSTLLRHHELLSQLHKDVGCAVRNTTAEYVTMPWRMIIDQANAAAKSNGRLFNKTNRLESMRPKRIGESIQIANRNALVLHSP